MSVTSTPGGIGRTLREARERRGLSLRQIANTTRIAVAVLESLERDDISRLPGGIFSRAFVRSYAVEVGLDPELVIRDFIAQFPVDSVTAGHPAARPVEDGGAVDSQRRMAGVFGRLIALSIPIVALLLYFGTGEVTPRSETIKTPAPERTSAAAEPVAAPAVPETVAVPSQRSGLPTIPDRLLISMVATGPCWVSATVDGELAFERELRAGERELVEVRDDIVLTAGDASALTLTLNGQQAKPLGSAGRVVTVRMTRANFMNYVINQ
jgi:cytoskeletal protein RodZ